jgi:hypothetical protein
MKDIGVAVVGRLRYTHFAAHYEHVEPVVEGFQYAGFVAVYSRHAGSAVGGLDRTGLVAEEAEAEDCQNVGTAGAVGRQYI